MAPVAPVAVPPTTPQALRRNLAFDGAVAVSVGLTTAVAGSLVPAIARGAGLAPLGIAVMSAAPFLGNLLSAFAGRTGPHAIRGYAVLRVTSALLLVAIAVAPNPLLIAAFTSVFWLTLSFAAPFQTRLWGAMYPGEVRGSVIGILGMAKAAASVVGAFAVGAAADRLGVPAAIGLAGVLGGVFGAGAGMLRSARPLPARRYSAREAVRAMTGRRPLMRLITGQLVFGLGSIAAIPLFALVYVDRLHLSLGEVGTVAVLGGIATTVAYLAAGRLIDRRGHEVVLVLGAGTGAASLLCVALAPGLPLLWLGAVLGGLSNAGIDIGIQGAMFAHAPHADRAAAMAGWNAITGPRGIVAPLLASAAVQAGLLDVTGALLVCVVPAVLGTGVYVWAWRRNHRGPDAAP